ncbi:MAG: RHS repeat-associated core domain-containing protein [Pirellulales bacterium]
MVERLAYTAFGQPTFTNASGSALSSSAKATRYTFTGREWDSALELHHFRASWMSGVSGRFMGRDPIDYEGSEWNLYEIFGGDALSETDSSGLAFGLAVDSVSGAIQQCMKKATPAAQIECLELFISQGFDKKGVLKQLVNKIKYGKPRPPRPNRRQNRRGTNCTEAQVTYYYGMVTLACKTNSYSCGQEGAKTDLCPKELLARSTLAGGCATVRFTYQRMCFPRSHPEWQEHENKRAEALKTASICLAKAKRILVAMENDETRCN